MSPASVQQAADAFLRGDYSIAIELYRELSRVLGEQYFRANVELCRRHLGGSDRKLVSLTAPRRQIAPELKKLDVQPRVLNWDSLVELPKKTPIWHVIPVKEGKELLIEAAIEYCQVKEDNNRKAVLLLKTFDENGCEVEKNCGKMAKSSHLHAWFKYLPNTFGRTQQIHSFIVPEKVTEIHLGMCGFNIQKEEQVFVKKIQVREKQKTFLSDDFVPPSPQAAEISILGWPEYPDNGKPYVMGIMDEFTTGCFEQDVNLIQPRPDNWYALAEKYKPELIFIESAWKGNFGSWQYRVAEYSNKPGQEVAQLCRYAREKGIPTIFWNKEDPVHHDKFMCSAKLVDSIFTTDANMKKSYLKRTGNLNVYALPFAAQPALHKPAPLRGRRQRSCFAGSWYGNRHAERGQSMQWLLKVANQYGLDIFDRNYGTGIFPFPEEYQQGIKGSLPYKELCVEYSRYRIFLNVNSVVDSPTMFSRRVFELMACGTPVVSTYAKGIESLFDLDAVWLVRNQEEAQEAIHTLMTDDVEWRRRSLAGIREVFAKHTYAHRLNTIFSNLKISTRIPTDPPVLLVAKAESKAALNALNQFARGQRYRRFVLGVECSIDVSAGVDELSENITLLELGDKTAWVESHRADYPIMGWLTARHQYGEYYLRDLANASLYEPTSIGWAKASDRDHFSLGGQAALGAVLWNSAVFIETYLHTLPDTCVERQDLYLADSDQFVQDGAALQTVMGS